MFKRALTVCYSTSENSNLTTKYFVIDRITPRFHQSWGYSGLDGRPVCDYDTIDPPEQAPARSHPEENPFSQKSPRPGTVQVYVLHRTHTHFIFAVHNP